MLSVVSEILAAARAVADDVLFPNATATDAADVLPVGNLDALAGAGLYGLVGPRSAGALEADFETAAAVQETLAGGCLATTFVWAQHHWAVRLVADGAGGATGVRDRWLGPLCRGERRAGIALAGLLPGPPRLRARPDGDGWRIDGSSPWMTGWGQVDVVLVAARGPGETVVSLLADAVPQPGLTVTRQRLVAVDASVTVQLDFDSVAVPGDRLVSVEPYEEGLYSTERSLRSVGMTGVGVTARCCRLLGPSPLDDEVAAVRKQLLTVEAAGLPAARAASAELTVRAATALVVHAGSGSIVAGQHPQRLAREAVFLLVFGGRPAIKASLLTLLGATPE